VTDFSDDPAGRAMPSRASSRTRTAARLKGHSFPMIGRVPAPVRDRPAAGHGRAVFLARQAEQGGGPPAWGFLRAFAEAAMVGGLADWFAVTALFRHPLGLPIPHTAIIPENKDRLADSMAGFLRENFLTPQVVARRLAGMNAAAMAGGFLTDPRGGEGRVRAGAANLVADVLDRSIRKSWAASPRGLARPDRQVRSGAAAGPVAGRDDRRWPAHAGDRGWRAAALALEANEELLRTMIHDRANAILRWTGLDERLANGILDGLYKLLAETVVMPDHPLRRKIEEGLEQLAHDLVHDEAMRARVERMKEEVLANPAFAAWLDAVWERGRAGLLKAVRQPDGVSRASSGRAWANWAGRSSTTRGCNCWSTASPGARWWAWRRAMAGRSCGWYRKRCAAGMRAP
jgi:hypothetical protein